MSARVLFRDSQGRDGQVVLTPGTPCYVGRSLDCAIRSDDAMVSRKHSLIHMENGRFVVEDLGSANGTHVNERRVTKQALGHNDVVRCGSLWLRFVQEEAAPVEPPPKMTSKLPAPAPERPASASVAPPMEQPQVSTGGSADSELADELEKLQGLYDREVADGKRIRSEAKTLRDRIEDMRQSLQDKDDQIAAHEDVAEDLRHELGLLKQNSSGAEKFLRESKEDLKSRETQLAKAEDEIGRLKDELSEVSQALTAATKAKDESWGKLNEQMTEIEQLRQVINEQEKMVEERRVGLMGQDSAIKELRSEREQHLEELATFKNQLRELSESKDRLQAKVETLEEENHRVTKLLADSSGGGAEAAELTNQLRDLRVVYGRLEADFEKATSDAKRLHEEAVELREQRVQLEVSLRESQDRASTVSGEQESWQAQRAEFEIERSRIIDDLAKVELARDEAIQSSQQIQIENTRLKRELELACGGDDNSELQVELQVVRQQLEAARANVAAVDAKWKIQVNELNAKLEAAPAASSGDSAVLQDMAMEAYEDTNDVLSEIRNNVRLLNDEIRELTKGQASEGIVLILDTLESLQGATEDAKGAIRKIKEVAES